MRLLRLPPASKYLTQALHRPLQVPRSKCVETAHHMLLEQTLNRYRAQPDATAIVDPTSNNEEVSRHQLAASSGVFLQTCCAVDLDFTAAREEHLTFSCCYPWRGALHVLHPQLLPAL